MKKVSVTDAMNEDKLRNRRKGTKGLGTWNKRMCKCIESNKCETTLDVINRKM